MKKRTYNIIIAISISIVILVFAVVGYSFYKHHHSKRAETQASTTPSATIQPTAGAFLNDNASYFEIHYFDVGEGDSALVACDDHYLLIDGGPSSSSSFLYSYLKENQITYLDYIVCTHAHEDHVGGLSGALNYASVGVAFCSVTEYDGRAFQSFLKYLNKQEASITVPNPGDTFSLGSASAQFIGPIDMNLAEINANNSSIVLKITYGETSFLFTGDAESEEESSLVNAHFDLTCDVLKIGHHGSYTSSSDVFLKAVQPKYCVISVGKDNVYGHPHSSVVERLLTTDAIIFRTDTDGEIICTSDGTSLSFTTKKGHQN